MAKRIVAVDFDNTLSMGGEFPNTGKPNEKLFEYLKARQHNGDIIILWSCRCGADLELAVKYCEVNGLVFDYVNENTPEMIERFGNDSRKIFAHLYIDDASKHPYEITHYEKPEKPKRQPRKARIVR